MSDNGEIVLVRNLTRPFTEDEEALIRLGPAESVEARMLAYIELLEIENSVAIADKLDLEADLLSAKTAARAFSLETTTYKWALNASEERRKKMRVAIVQAQLALADAHDDD